MQVQMNVRYHSLSSLRCSWRPLSACHATRAHIVSTNHYWRQTVDSPNDPNNPWDPEPPCVTGYYVAIDSCPGCTGVSYALCTGFTFTQCVCGGPFWPGVQCAKSLVCCPNDFPPYNWLELKRTLALAGPA